MRGGFSAVGSLVIVAVLISSGLIFSHLKFNASPSLHGMRLGLFVLWQYSLSPCGAVVVFTLYALSKPLV